MVPTLPILGSKGKVMAPIGSGIFFQGKRQTIRVTAVSPDENTSSVITEALVGMEISTIFTTEQFPHPYVPEGSRFSYASEVIEALQAAGKTEAAEELQILAGNEFDMYIFEPETYE